MWPHRPGTGFGDLNTCPRTGDDDANASQATLYRYLTEDDAALSIA
jgi:hypothetical protein